MTDELLLDAEDRMDKAVASYGQTLASIRTGRASTALVAHLQIAHYEQTTPLNQLATLAVPEPQLITIQPWDKGVMDAIMKAIQTSDLGINPSNDGAIIRLPVPPLTEERRKEMVKQVGVRTEEARVAIRNVRRRAIDDLRKALKAKEISEDDERRAQGDVDTVTAAHIKRLETISKEKERELLEV